MKILINATSVICGGGLTYLKQLLEQLARIDNENDYYILVTKAKNSEFRGVEKNNFKIIESGYLKFPIVRVLWEQVGLPIFLKKNKIDLLFSPANVSPLFTPCKNVLAIQNLAPFFEEILNEKRCYQKIRIFILKILSILSVKKSDGVIFVSNYAKEIFEKKYGLSREKSYVIYHGISDLFRNKITEREAENIKFELGIEKEYILSVSTILYRYKNVIELIEAFSKIKDRTKNKFQLVIVGKITDKAYYNDIKKIIEKYRLSDDVLLLGEISHDKLPYLYAGSSLFVFTSSCESFGLTQIEAMASGVPVITSNASAMPEVCREAALYFDPKNYNDIAEKMLKVLQSLPCQRELRKNGLKRAADFSWEKTAKETLKVFEEIYNLRKYC